VVSRGGSAFSAPAVPTVRMASSAEDFALMEDDLDVDITAVAQGRETIEAAGRRLFEQWLRFASGDDTCGEALGIGENEFVPWPIGVFA
jgi:altronate hydrolase